MDAEPAAPAGGPAVATGSETGRQIARITPRLLLGPARVAADAELLARERVTFCVNVTRQQPCPRAPGVRTLRVPIFDDPAEDLLTHLEPCCAALEEAARAGGTCLVYCKNGRSRSAAVCTAYLMRHGGLSLEQAFQVGGAGAAGKCDWPTRDGGEKGQTRGRAQPGLLGPAAEVRGRPPGAEPQERPRPEALSGASPGESRESEPREKGAPRPPCQCGGLRAQLWAA
ncbi:dual specificity phosphatase 28 isoform X1 [Sminthopsis crassicaudata]|uniref:dual specificity phosphatase 28 isoform X1 n=1 Tax=Sminthopsis crassicaudata TaxID=9301 RepID=UPI003D69C528